ncbi:MAG: hypothetical protein WKF96_05765 [Solirubrobacteraceae bacterium]
MDSPSKTILLIAPRGSAARFLLQTEFLPTLQAAGARIVVMTPEATMPTLSPRALPDLITVEPLRMPSGPPSGGRVVTLVRALVGAMRRAALDGRASPAFGIRYRRFYAAYREAWPRWLSSAVRWVVMHVLWRSSMLRRLVCWADVSLSRSVVNSDVFDRHAPDLVVGASLGYFKPDEVVFQEAVRRGVRTAALISGWDNPTSKGYRAVGFDLVVAWSDRMRQEIIRFHDVAPDRVKVAGVPHWDAYLSPGALPTRGKLCAILGLDPAKRLVFHATFPPRSNSRSCELIATALAEATSSGSFGDDVQLVIRLHPKHMRPGGKEARRPYERLAAMGSVHVNHPDVVEAAGLRTEPSLEDGQILGGLLKHCEVLVNIFSTTTLEAFLLDRPVVMAVPDPSSDAHDRNSYVANPSLWSDYVHLQPLVDSGAARVAYSIEELIEHVSTYLDDPSLEREVRRDIARLECGPTDGRAGERTARLVLEELGITPAPAHQVPVPAASSV